MSGLLQAPRTRSVAMVRGIGHTGAAIAGQAHAVARIGRA